MASEEKNQLVSQSVQQVDTYYVRGDEFSVQGSGSDKIPAGKPHGYAEGHNELATAPEGNRNLEDDGDMTPSVWGKGGKTWAVEVNKGEANSSADSVSYVNSVNCVTGQMDGGEKSVIGETSDMNVHIPATQGKVTPGVSTRGVGSASVGVGNTSKSK